MARPRGTRRCRAVRTSIHSTCSPSTASEFGHGPGDFPVTERVAATTLALPWSSLLAQDEVDQVAEALIAGIREQAGS